MTIFAVILWSLSLRVALPWFVKAAILADVLIQLPSVIVQLQRWLS